MEPSYLNIAKLTDHLFRRESGKMISYVTKIIGFGNIEKAEDIVQDTLLEAMQTWAIRGIPDNPPGWLFRVARNKALNLLKHERIAPPANSISEKELSSDNFGFYENLIFDFDRQILQDDVLRMMFACCDPAISEEYQITFILKIICGFSTAEVAKAFFTSEDTISKRLYRMKEQFRNHSIALNVSSPDISPRTKSILNAVYLLFNEGYNSTHSEAIIRNEIIEEALLLGKLLIENNHTQGPDAFALMALMCFHTSRMESRISTANEIILLEQQDRTKWDKEMINLGVNYFEKAAIGDSLSNYHLEAAIAFEHCAAPTFKETNWEKILQYYDWLENISASPTTKLSKAVALMYVYGPEKSLLYIESLKDKNSFSNFYLYQSLLGEIYFNLNQHSLSENHYNSALHLTKSEAEKRLLKVKLARIVRSDLNNNSLASKVYKKPCPNRLL